MTSATSPRGPGTRVRRPSDTVVADLLEAAATEFAAHGFAGASTRRIAERAGAHQPQINYHFTSKEQLWRATVDHLFGLMDAALAGLDGSGPLRGGVRRGARPPSSSSRPIGPSSTASSTSRPPPRRPAWTGSSPPTWPRAWPWWARRGTSCGRADGAPTSPPARSGSSITSFGAMHFANAPMLAQLGIHTGDGRTEASAHAARLLAVLFPGSPRP